MGHSTHQSNYFVCAKLWQHKKWHIHNLQVCGMYLINAGQQMAVDVMEPMVGGKHIMSFQSWCYHFITAYRVNMK
jgi:hypothetical protein